jgi:hypothetical protein
LTSFGDFRYPFFANAADSQAWSGAHPEEGDTKKLRHEGTRERPDQGDGPPQVETDVVPTGKDKMEMNLDYMM